MDTKYSFGISHRSREPLSFFPDITSIHCVLVSSITLIANAYIYIYTLHINVAMVTLCHCHGNTMPL